MTDPTIPDAPHAGGEEWRDLDQADAAYDPSAHADTLRAARTRIGEIRMRDVELRLVDRAGAPVVDAPVEIVQTRSAFPFGDQLWALDAMIRDGQGATGKADAWKQRFTDIFNAANNLCYWTERDRNDASKTEDRQGEPRVENFAETVDWTLAQGMLAKGHPLFWSIPKCIPEWVKRYDTATQMKFAEVRVRNLVARFKGRVRMWDAVNEPMWEPAPKNLAARQWPHIEPIADVADYIEPVLRWCREEDPDALYVINDYGMDNDAIPASPPGSDGSTVTPATQRRRFLSLMEELGTRGQPPDAIGLQSHSGWPGHAHQWEIYDEFATAGLPLQVTEFWAHTGKLEKCGRFSREEIDTMQAEFICNFLTCAFGHPAVEAFFFWGFMGDAIRWTERSGHEEKPVFERVRQLIREEWMTRATLRTSAEGIVRFRGYLGDYTLRRPLGAGTQRGTRFEVDRVASMPLKIVADRG